MTDTPREAPRLDSRPPRIPEPSPFLWLWLPPILAVAILLAGLADPELAWRWLFQEGWGALELAHFVIPLLAAWIALRAFRALPRGADRWLQALLLALVVGSVYIAGEEHSWGQHFFNWETPESWAEFNRQDETNLHNATSWLNHKPRVLLNTGILFGTVLIPLAVRLGRAPAALERIRFILPGRICHPVGVLALLYMSWDHFAKEGYLPDLALREAEVQELWLYSYILAYAWILSQRIRLWRSGAAE